MEADAGVGLGGIIPTLCTSRKDEAAMKDELAGTAARHPESNFTESLCKSVNVCGKIQKEIKLTTDGRRHTQTAIKRIVIFQPQEGSRPAGLLPPGEEWILNMILNSYKKNEEV